MNIIEDLVKKYGEEYRELITKSIEWLNKEKPSWDLKRPINRAEYVKDLIQHTTRFQKKGKVC